MFFTDTTDKSPKKLIHLPRVLCKNITTNLQFNENTPKQGDTKLGVYRYTKYSLDDDVFKILNRSVQSDSDLESQVVKIIMPSNILDFHTTLEILLGLKLSSHSHTLTEASKLFGDLYKRGEIQNEQQY